MSVKIITDSTSYINENLRKELDIKILPLYVSFQDESIKETDIEKTDISPTLRSLSKCKEVSSR